MTDPDGTDAPTDGDMPVDTREALLRSAIRVIARMGLRGATYRSIAADAGLTHGMIVHHFGSRDALIAAAMEYATSRTLRGAALPANGDFGEIGAHLDLVVSEDRDSLAFHREMRSEAIRRRDDVSELVVRAQTDLETAVRRQLAAVGVEREELVILVASAMEGLTQRQLLIDDQSIVDEAMEALRDLLRASVSSGGDRTDQAGSAAPGAPSR